MKIKGFAIIELLIIVTIISVIAVMLLFLINPVRIIEEAKFNTTKANLNQIAKAALMYEAEAGRIPPDTNRNIPTEFMPFLGPGVWPKGPFEGSVYDWDNWLGRTCHNGRPGGVQVTLRDIQSFRGVRYSYTIPDPNNPNARINVNVNGQPHFAIYMVIYGEGIPHCSNANVVGVCINC